MTNHKLVEIKTVPQKVKMREKRRKRSKPFPTKMYIASSLNQTPKMREFIELVQPFEAVPTKAKIIYSPIFAYLHDESGYLAIMLKIEETTTVQDLRDAIPLALSLRDRLLEFQGPWINGGDTRFYEDLLIYKENGESWTTLADSINASVAAHLKNWDKYLCEYKKAVSTFKTWGDYDSWNAKQEGSSDLYHAKDLMRLMKLPDSEIDDLCKQGLDRIAKGEVPFDRGYPIDADELRTTVRSWKSGRYNRYHQNLEESKKKTIF